MSNDDYNCLREVQRNSKCIPISVCVQEIGKERLKELLEEKEYINLCSFFIFGTEVVIM